MKPLLLHLIPFWSHFLWTKNIEINVVFIIIIINLFYIFSLLLYLLNRIDKTACSMQYFSEPLDGTCYNVDTFRKLSLTGQM